MVMQAKTYSAAMVSHVDCRPDWEPLTRDTGVHRYKCGLAITDELFRSIEEDMLFLIRDAHQGHHDEGHSCDAPTDGRDWPLESRRDGAVVTVYCPGSNG